MFLFLHVLMLRRRDQQTGPAIRGLGNAPAVRGLLRCQKAEEADVHFLSETKMDERRMMSLKQRLGMVNMEVVVYEGKGEGVKALVWFW